MRSLPGFPLPSRLILPALLALAPALSAQVVRGVFVTPIPDAPFSGTVDVQKTVIQPDGTTLALRSERLIARDGTGRIYNEARPLVPASSTVPPPVTLIHLYDPQSRMAVYMIPGVRTYRVSMLNRPPSADTLENYGAPPPRNPRNSTYTHQEDLGDRTLAGLQVHGVRLTQTLPPEESGTGAEVVVTDEYWYSDELRINLETKHVDPRTGSLTTTVTQVNREEPDAALFQVPGDYRMAGLRPPPPAN